MREFLMVSGWLLHYLVHSAVVLAIVGAVTWLGDRLLRGIGPQAQHRVWVAALLTGVTLPLLPSGMLSHFFAHANAGAAGGTAAVTYRMIAATPPGRWTVSPLLAWLLAGGYLLTVLFCLTQLMWRWRRSAGMARRSEVVQLNGRVQSLMQRAARRFGVTVPKVLCSAETHGPVVMGLRKAVLLAPEDFFNAPEEDVAAALMHECAHIARQDFAKNLLYEFVAAAVAYHPALWLMRRRIAETREIVCDEMAASAMGERAEYAASLLRLASGIAAPEVRLSQAIGVFDANILEERIMRLTTNVVKVSRVRKIAMACVAAMVLLGGAVTAMAVPFDVTSQAESQEKVYKVGNGVSAPILVHSVDAEFSKRAKDAKYQGVAVVGCVVDSNGMPVNVHTVRKLGMGLDEKALEAVRQYRFNPGMLNGKPVAVAITIEVNFRLY